MPSKVALDMRAASPHGARWSASAKSKGFASGSRLRKSVLPSGTKRHPLLFIQVFVSSNPPKRAGQIIAAVTYLERFARMHPAKCERLLNLRLDQGDVMIR